LVEFEGFPESKVVVIPNGVDTDRFRPDPAARRSVREELGLPSDTRLVCIVAALRPEKNHQLFVEGSALTHAQRPDTHFVIIGDGPERASIEAKVQELGIQHVVHLLGSRSDTPRLLAAMDAFALTSHNEASPVSILEALACQVPVVATNVGSVSESVIDGWNGHLIEPGSTGDLSRCVLRILADREMAEDMGYNGRQHVLQHGSLDHMIREYESLIHRIYESKL
jgi:glycosyltransferase involved in cell wall biosynthesis